MTTALISTTSTLLLAPAESVTGAAMPVGVHCGLTVCSAWRDTSYRTECVCRDAHWDSIMMETDALDVMITVHSAGVQGSAWNAIHHTLSSMVTVC